MAIPVCTVEVTESPPRARFDLAWLALVFGGLFLVALGSRPLANPDEPRYADIPREMLAHGDWVTPRLNETVYFEKPPLVYWAVAACRTLLGPGEWSMRLTPALFALGGVLLTYAAARRLQGRAAGVLAALVLGTSLLYFALSQLLLLDMAVSVLMSATLFCFILGVRESAGARRRWLFYGLYASAALATLTKGLIGFLVTGAVMFLWLLLFNQWKRLRPLHLPTGILVFLAIAAPWHVLAAQRNPGWARFYFIHEHWERFTTTEHARYEPWWYFIPVVLLGIFPWTGFLWSATRDVFARGWARRTENAETWFFLTWAGFVFLFFSKSQSKLIPYMLPVMPPLAVIIGGWLASRLAARAGERLKAGLRIFGFFAGLFAIALLAAAFKPGAIRDAQQASAVRPFAIAGAVIFLVGGVAAPWLARLRGPRAALTAMAATAAAFYLVLLAAAPSFQRAGTKDLALVARERIAPGDRVFHYWAFFHDFVYYTERPVGLVGYLDELEVQFVDPAERRARFIDDADLRRLWAESQRVWLVVRKRDQQAPKSVFTDPAFHYHLIAESRTHSLVSNQP